MICTAREGSEEALHSEKNLEHFTQTVNNKLKWLI